MGGMIFLIPNPPNVSMYNREGVHVNVVYLWDSMVHVQCHHPYNRVKWWSSIIIMCSWLWWLPSPFLQHLRGSVGLLFTNKSKEEVEEWFKSFAESDFARSGFTAEESVSLDAGALEQFPHNMEPQLRQLGLPTALKKGNAVSYNIDSHDIVFHQSGFISS